MRLKVSLCAVTEKNSQFWEFCPCGGEGHPIPKSTCQNIGFFVKTKNRNGKVLGILPLRGGGRPIPKSKCQNIDFLVKTKNVPYDLKCKIDPKLFFVNRISQKGE